MASAQDTTCAARAGEGPAPALRRSWPGDLLVFFVLRLGSALPAGSRRSFVDDVVAGFLDVNEREPGLGGDHDVGHVVVERVPVLDVGR